jgi:hypothetical protein
MLVFALRLFGSVHGASSDHFSFRSFALRQRCFAGGIGGFFGGKMESSAGAIG